jgi:hypothetical protein
MLAAAVDGVQDHHSFGRTDHGSRGFTLDRPIGFRSTWTLFECRPKRW